MEIFSKKINVCSIFFSYTHYTSKFEPSGAASPQGCKPQAISNFFLAWQAGEGNTRDTVSNSSPEGVIFMHK